MAQASLFQGTVLDLVPFGNAGNDTGFFALRLSPPGWEGWAPGQFIMLRAERMDGQLVWARPFSICRATSRDLVIFFQVRGRATADMARLEPGDQVRFWGPLGNALAMEPKTSTLLLAGGIGIAPFVGYVHTHPSPWDLTMEFGHRMPANCYPLDGIAEKINITAHHERGDDDREAFLELVERRVAAHAKGLVLACGPTLFLKTVRGLAEKYRARTQLCLETRMACGIGACLGCVVKARMPGTEAAAIPAARKASAPGPAGSEAAGPGSVRREHAGVDEAHHVQTCTCGPNFWADSVIL